MLQNSRSRCRNFRILMILCLPNLFHQVTHARYRQSNYIHLIFISELITKNQKLLYVVERGYRQIDVHLRKIDTHHLQKIFSCCELEDGWFICLSDQIVENESKLPSDLEVTLIVEHFLQFLHDEAVSNDRHCSRLWWGEVGEYPTAIFPVDCLRAH